MMVTAASDMDPNVISILSTLQSKTSSHEDRTEAYLQFSNNLKDDDVSLFSLDVSKHATQILSVIEKDVLGDNTDVSQGALQVLGFVLHDNEIVRNLSSDVSSSILSVLCQCVLKTEDKTTCTRALWCLGKQSLSPDLILKHLHSLKCALEHALTKWKSQSVTVEHEAFNVIARLLEKCPKEMKQQVVWWAKLLLPLLVHSAIKVRERVLELIQSELPTLMTCQVELAKFLEIDFNKKFAEELRKLYVMKNEAHVLNCWGLIVQLLGETLHQGSSLINILLPIVELGFKSQSPGVKCITFQAWQQLVDNFASNQSILTDPRRVKLIMQVFKINNAKVESVAKVKLQVWWHFVWLLGSKVSAFFDQVCVPLLQFCMGNRLGSQTAATTPRGLKNGTGPITPQLNLSNMASSPQMAVFPVLQQQCCEILAHFLGNIPNDLDVETPQYSLDPLSHDVVTGPAFFIKHANLFINTTTELICSLGKDIPEKLLHQIWYSLVAHMKNALENLKSEMREILSTFLTQFQIIVLSQALPHKSVMRLFEAVCCLPRKSLCSTAYNVSSGEKIHGTPALFLTELLLTPVLLHSSSMMTGYMVLVSKLVECGVGNNSGSLEYCQAALKMLSQNVNFVCGPETVWRIWSSIINPLHEQIKKTNEVNQGDALEHNFSCMYSILVFPVEQKLPANMPQPSVKTLMKTWCDVYRTFARLTALVANAEANICCEELCSKLVKAVTKEDMEDLSFLDFMVHICLVVVNCVDFSSLGVPNTFNLNSPAKWTKRKQKPMENIQSLVAVVCFLLDCITKASLCETSKKINNSLSLQSPANNMVDLLSMLYSHVSASSVISSMIGQLSKPVGELYYRSAMKTAAKIYNNVFMQKLEKLWEDICTCIQTRLISEPLDSQLLCKLSPLLESTFLHSRRNIKHQTAIFWKATFGRATTLEYPDSLKPVLLKVKEKNSLPLPGWTSTTVIPVIEETPVSQISQSQAPEPHIPGMPSPRRLHGSFLNKAVSPNIKKSPAKPESSPAADVAKKNILSVYDFTNNDFVVIKSPPRKKRVLTEHQKEVLKEKKSFPAMYNNLDVSQDVSLMASQFSSDTQTQPETPNPPSDSVIVIGSQQSEETEATQQPSTSLLNGGKNLNKVLASVSSDKVDNRRRSVRFKDSQKEEMQSQSLSTSPTDITSKSIEHFSVIKSLSQSNSVINVSSESQKETDSQSLISAGSSIPATVDDGIPQNVLGAVSAYDLLSSKSPSIESKKNETDSAGSVLSANSENDSEKNNNQPLLSWSNQLKSLSQTSIQNSQEQKTSQASQSLQTHLKTSQSPPVLSPLRSSQPLKSKSSQERKDDLLAQKRLDSWIMRSPSKGIDKSSEGSKTCVSGQSKTVCSTVVEETQSPKKDMIGKSSNLLNEALPSVMETPPRPSLLTNSEDSNSRSSIKKLFAEGADNADGSLDSDHSNIIPSSPCNSKTVSKLGTPVLKLKRLTDEEIKHFSPKHREHKGMDSTKQPTKAVAIGTELSDGLVEHEHDDFSAIKPLDSEDIIPSSQGFVPCETKVSKTSVKSLCIANTGIENMQDSKIRVVQNKIHDESNAVKTDKEKKTMGSENLFTEDAFSDEGLYNPLLNDTFDNVVDVTPSKLCNQQNLQEENLQSTRDSEESCNINSNVEISKSPEEYDPNQASTLGCDAEVKTPRRGRKRKQDTPKKMSPESIKPKRRRPNKTTEKASENQVSEKGSISNKGSNNEKEDQVEAKEIQKQSVNRTTHEEQDDIIICDSQVTGSQTPRLRGRPRKTAVTTPSVARKKLREKKTEAEPSEPKDVTVVEVHRNFEGQKKLVDENSNLEKKIEQTKQKDQDILNDLDKISDQAVILGQKTPETTTLQTVPQRKSTTKKKMEVAQKWSQNKEKAVIINSGGSNLDSDSSEDDRPLMKSAKKLNSLQENFSESREKMQTSESGPQVPENKQISDDDLALLKEAERMEDEVAIQSQGNIEDRSMDREKSSENSEDDLPLSDLSKKKLMKDQEDNVPLTDDNMNESVKRDLIKDSSKKDTFSEELLKDVCIEKSDSSQDVVDLTSSQSQKIRKGQKKKKVTTVKTSLRLRSSELFLRTGKPIKKPVEKIKPAKSLRLKKAKKLDGKTTEESKTENKVDNDENLDIVQTESCENIESERQNEATKLAVTDQELGSTSSEEMKKSVVDKSATELNTVGSSVESKEGMQVSDGDIDETPRKIPDKEMIVPSAFSLFERHSDSKLITVSRKFDKKRPVIARRSILKPSTTQSSTLGSPSNKKQFHPIRVGHIYSPSASPSAGILKRRRLSGDQVTNSPSPPSKQRRVSFSEPLTFEKEQLTSANADIRAETGRPQSPLVTSAATKVSSSLEKYFTTPAVGSDTCINSCSENKQDSQMTQSSYKSTQESQLNATQPIYPELLECSVNVERVLPQLTSSMWMRGLGQLVRARKIHTVGDLSALTEREVDNLPIRSPKISTVRSALRRFESQEEAKKNKGTRGEPPVSAGTSQDEADDELNSNVADVMTSSSEILAKVSDVISQDRTNTVVEDILNCTGHVDSNRNDQSQDVAGADPASSAVGLKTGKISLLQKIEDISFQCHVDDLKDLKMEEIFKIQHHLSSMSNTVMAVLKAKCNTIDSANS